jgi:hypothetical protein
VSFARVRDLNGLVGHGGTSYRWFPPDPNPTIIQRVSSNGETRHCLDTVGNFPKPNPLDLSIVTVKRPNLDGELWSGSNLIRKLVSYPIDLVPAPPDPRSKFPVFDEIDRSSLAWDLLSRTNISQPHISVPTFVGELKDLPSLVRGWGSNLLSKIAKGHLTWRWAVRPMIGDIRKLLMFQAAVNRRCLDLSIMRVQRYVKRKASLDGQTITEGPVSVFAHTSSGFTAKYDRTRTFTSKVWGSVKWKLDPSVVLPELDSELYNYAWRLTFGITTHELLATLWELTPWSWFIDWFTGIGKIIAATNNTIKATWAELCIMRTSLCRETFVKTTGWPAWCTTDSDNTQTHERKERWPSTPLLPFIPSLRPLVSLKAWSILASLAALRGSRGLRSAPP